MQVRFRSASATKSTFLATICQYVHVHVCLHQTDSQGKFSPCCHLLTLAFYDKYLSEICILCKTRVHESIKALKSGASGAPPLQTRACNFVFMNCNQLNLRLLGDIR